jgi:hypothetical protein
VTGGARGKDERQEKEGKERSAESIYTELIKRKI